jgi:hypothetical protein
VDPEHEHQIGELYRDCELAVREQRSGDALNGFEQLLDLLEAAGDRIGRGRVLVRMASTCADLSRPEQARAHTIEAEQIARDAGDQALLAAALHRRAHLLRSSDPAAARELFQQSYETDATDAEGRAVSLAMIGQIDFTEGDQAGGLDTMLEALDSMPPDSDAYGHLIEHIAYFGRRLPRAEYVRLVGRRIRGESLRDRLL